MSRQRQRVREVLIVGVLGWFVISMLVGSKRPGFGLRGTDLVLTLGVVAVIGCCVLGIYAHRRDLPYAALTYTIGAVVCGGLYWIAPSRPANTMLFVFTGFAAGRHALRWSIPTAIVSAGGMAITILGRGRPPGELWTIVGLLGMYAGVRAATARQSAREVEQRNMVLAERAHIAREIHDILAHSLSAQLVHLEGARLLLAGGRTEEALDRVERARGLARSGLDETRRALATLRGDIPPVDEVLRELTEEHRFLAGARCDLRTTGEPRHLSTGAGLAVIRTAQEALTNARKHAPGADVTIDLRYVDDACELVVSDTGRAREPDPLAETGSGYGLVGMRERAELIGGTLDAGPEGKGFQVLLRVPA
jgi:signal transduction histidine kinase